MVGAVLAVSGAPMLAVAGITSAAQAESLSLEDAIALCPTVKVYTVEEGSSGLFEISARYLGDSLRAQEIYQLNQGKEQADGASLGTDRQLRAGWKLILPDDANGAGVTEAKDPYCVVRARNAAAESGPSPSSSVSPSSSPSPSASASAAAGTDHGEESPLDPRLLGAGAGALVVLTILALWWRPIFKALWWPFKRLAAVNWPRPRLPDVARAWLARRSRREATEVMRADKGARTRAGVAIIELTSAPAAVPARPMAALVDGEDIRVIVPGDATLPVASWRAEEDTVWRRVPQRSATTSAAPFATMSQVLIRPAQAMLVGLGTADGAQVFVDFSRLAGPLAIGGYRPIAREAVRVIAQAFRAQHGREVTVLEQGQSLEPLLPERAETEAGWGHVATDALWGPAEPTEGRRVIAVPRPLTVHEEDALADTPPGVVVVVVGESSYAHWQWRVTERGVLDTGPLGLSVLLRLPEEDDQDQGGPREPR
ncbi:hypothetical protein GCM10022402_08770 [Salinactinospora qingdaonensis]|uniref:LysM domain-containing protein n=2 Tax=Salinactinospora qingdaonensis TaxID=702744 RepID=A0ABP7F2Y8_9ACTN